MQAVAQSAFFLRRLRGGAPENRRVDGTAKAVSESQTRAASAVPIHPPDNERAVIAPRGWRIRRRAGSL